MGIESRESLPFSRRLLLATGAGVAMAERRTAVRSRTRRLDFEDAAVGAPPTGFSFALTVSRAPVRWVVLEDASSPAAPKVLAETSRDRTSDRFPLAILDGVTARDVPVSVRFWPVSGSVDQAVGLVLRLHDAWNYCIARANALEDKVRLYHVVDGRRIQFASVNARVPRNRCQVLGLRVEDDRRAVSLGGCEFFTATDQPFAEAGHVGLWTKADSLTHFDSLEVQALH
jgi:hypothetical protein